MSTEADYLVQKMASIPGYNLLPSEAAYVRNNPGQMAAAQARLSTGNARVSPAAVPVANTQSSWTYTVLDNTGNFVPRTASLNPAYDSSLTYHAASGNQPAYYSVHGWSASAPAVVNAPPAVINNATVLAPQFLQLSTAQQASYLASLNATQQTALMNAVTAIAPTPPTVTATQGLPIPSATMTAITPIAAPISTGPIAVPNPGFDNAFNAPGDSTNYAPGSSSVSPTAPPDTTGTASSATGSLLPASLQAYTPWIIIGLLYLFSRK